MKSSIFRYEGHNYLVPFLIISSLFFMWGFAHGILEVLNPHFQESFHISKTMSALTQAAVYGSYFLMALPAGWIIQKWGYRRGVITGLVLFGIGSLMFIPGSEINSFYFFVLSLFVIGCGLTCPETSANPYTTVLGHPDKAESRINLSQSLNGIGWIVGPLVGGQLLFSGVNIAIPYALVGIFVLSVALILSRITLPDPRRAHEADTNEKIEEKPMKAMAFAFGMLTLFLYVAAQTGVNSFFINYAEESIHIEKQTASLYLAFGSDEGAKMAATYHSIISTVKLQGRSVWNYLIMENIKRWEYVDIMRGIAITLVVVGHIIQFNGIPMTNPVF